MGNMSYCRFENTARDLNDCVYAINNGEVDDLSMHEVEGLQNLIQLCEELLDSKEYIQEIIASYEGCF